MNKTAVTSVTVVRKFTVTSSMGKTKTISTISSICYTLVTQRVVDLDVATVTEGLTPEYTRILNMISKDNAINVTIKNQNIDLVKISVLLQIVTVLLSRK